MTALINPFWYAASGGATDPNFANVVLLLHFDDAGTNLTAAVDSSGKGHTFSGTMALTTSQQKFGTKSLDTTAGTGTSADSADWAFDAGQFTVECWARRTAAPPASGACFLAQWSGTTNLGWNFRISTTNLEFFYSTTGTDFPGVSGAYSPPLNTWVHVAADRDASNVLRVYADGVVIASASAAATLFNSTQLLYFGIDGGGIRRWPGQLDEIRITKGVARYGGAFTPPTAPFPNS